MQIGYPRPGDWSEELPPSKTFIHLESPFLTFFSRRLREFSIIESKGIVKPGHIKTGSNLPSVDISEEKLMSTIVQASVGRKRLELISLQRSRKPI